MLNLSAINYRQLTSTSSVQTVGFLLASELWLPDFLTAAIAKSSPSLTTSKHPTEIIDSQWKRTNRWSASFVITRTRLRGHSKKKKQELILLLPLIYSSSSFANFLSCSSSFFSAPLVFHSPARAFLTTTWRTSSDDLLTSTSVDCISDGKTRKGKETK